MPAAEAGHWYGQDAGDRSCSYDRVRRGFHGDRIHGPCAQIRGYLWIQREVKGGALRHDDSSLIGLDHRADELRLRLLNGRCSGRHDDDVGEAAIRAAASISSSAGLREYTIDSQRPPTRVER